MAGWTNRGKFNLLNTYFRAVAIPGGAFGVFLATSAVAPTADSNLKTDITEIATGNGYTAGGLDVDRNTTDFDVMTESDASDLGFIQLKDQVWTASGGPLPASGGGARWAGLTDRHATVGSRELLVYWDLAADRSVSVGQTLTLQNAEIKITET